MMRGATTTKNNYRGYHHKHIQPLIDHCPISEVTSETLDALYTELTRCRDHCAPYLHNGQCQVES
jgi:hypothetical protein